MFILRMTTIVARSMTRMSVVFEIGLDLRTDKCIFINDLYIVITILIESQMLLIGGMLSFEERMLDHLLHLHSTSSIITNKLIK